MSVVADVILVTGPIDTRAVEGVNAWLEGRHHCTLNPIDYDSAGGNKHHQCGIYTAAINYLDQGGLLAAVAAQRWRFPNCVQVLIKDENDDAFYAYHLDGVGMAMTSTSIREALAKAE